MCRLRTFAGEPTEEEFRSADVVLTPCGEYGTFCCGQNSGARACCDADNSTMQVGTGEVLLFDDTSSPTTTTNSAANTTATVTATACPNNINGTVQGDCKKEEAAAISLGALLGCALLVLAVLGSDWWHKKRQLGRRRRT